MWAKIKTFFKHSETLVFARLQVFVGTFLEVLINVDPTLFAGLFGKWFPIYLIAQGILTEYLRKRRDEDMK